MLSHYSLFDVQRADVNECLGGHNCHANAACTNNNGGFTCACKSGFEGDGNSCSGMLKIETKSNWK